MLLEKGDVDVNIQEFVTGSIALYRSIWFDEEETDIVEKLLKAGADPRITDIHGRAAYNLAMTPRLENHADAMLEKAAHLVLERIWC
jgi:ankyrin repeat protein